MQNEVDTCERIVDLIMDAKRIDENTTASFLIDLLDACVMECYFREHMTERDLLFHDTLEPYLTTYDSTGSKEEQSKFLANLHAVINAPSHPIRNRLLRLTADSPDLIAVIKAEGKV